MKKIILFSLALLLLFSVSACATPEDKESTERELYKIGLDLISVMDEMVGSAEYADIMATGSVNQLAASVDTKESSIVVCEEPFGDTIQGLLRVGGVNKDSKFQPNV